MSTTGSGRCAAVVVGVACFVGIGAIPAVGVEAQDSVVFGRLGGEIVDADGPIALAGDGNRLAVGTSTHVRMLEWDGREWSDTPCSIPLDRRENSEGPRPPGSVAFSDDGSTVAIGVPGSDGHVPGFVRVAEWRGAGWFSKGADIETEATTGSFGEAVDVSADGGRIVVGDPSSASATVVGWDGSAWLQIGDVIAGVGGAAVAMSADGNRVAIGDPTSRDTSVQVVEWDGAAWVPLGEKIPGGAGSGLEFGRSVAISADGSRLAVGAPATESPAGNAVRTFDWDGTSWIQAGADLVGASPHDQFGWSVDISADGTRLTSLAPGIGTDDGYVRVFKWTRGDWVSLTSRLDPMPGAPWSGAIATSADGQRIARLSGGRRSGIIGRVRVYQEGATVAPDMAPSSTSAGAPPSPGSATQGESSPVQLGEDIRGERSGEQFGAQIEMSADGGRFAAIGRLERRWSQQPPVPGRVYEWDGVTWIQLGDDIGPDGDWLPHSISLSGRGERVALGDEWFSACERPQGQVRAYEWSDDQWRPMGEPILSPDPYSRLGRQVELSHDGRRLAVQGSGSWYHETQTGSVRRIEIWDWDGATWRFTMAVPVPHPDPEDWTPARFALSAAGDRIAVWHEHDIEGYDVHVFELVGNEARQLGASIPDLSSHPWTPSAVVLSADGSRVAFGHEATEVHEWDGSAWTPLGEQLTGRIASGSVDLDRIAVRADVAEGSSLRIYDWDESVWVPVARVDADAFLSATSMSASGLRVATGHAQPWSRGAGFVRVAALPAPAATGPAGPSSATSTTNSTVSAVATSTIRPGPAPTLPATGNTTPTAPTAAAVALLTAGMALIAVRRRTVR